MLTKLSISNYALIDSLSVEFIAGLNTITGETGAGKSIILGALGLILGNRADLSALKNKSQKCIVEGIFEIGNYKIEPFFTKNDLDYDPSTILRREITPSGKSRAFINDTPVNLKLLRELGLKLIDIHSQHQNLELGNQQFQLELVDAVARTSNVLKEYKILFYNYLSLQKELHELMEQSEKAKDDLNYFQFQFNQLEEANLQEGEQEELETELEKLTHAEEIKTAFVNVQQLLDDERLSVIQNVKEGNKILESIQDFLKEVPPLAERLQSVLFELIDILEETNHLSEKIEHDPVRIEKINDRLAQLYSLQQKHRVSSVEELIRLRDAFGEKIARVTGYDDEIKRLEQDFADCTKSLNLKAAELTNLRKKAFSKIKKSVVSDMHQMGMAKSKFEIQHLALAEFGSKGKDAVSFLFSANPDATSAEISKIASGGEMSRLMLAVKNLLRKSKALPTVVFDEIDAGVSGEIALRMGAIIKSFSTSTQIINITHLPQIAARGDAHFQVYKLEKSGKTVISIKQLSKSERIEELAKMVGGENLTESTLKTAQELLNN